MKIQKAHTTKIVAGCSGIFIVGCIALLALTASRMFITDPNVVGSGTGSFVSYDTPDQYTQGALDTFGLYTWIVLYPANADGPNISLFRSSLKPNLTIEDLVDEFGPKGRQQTPDSLSSLNWKYTESVMVAVAGSNTEFSVYEASDSSGSILRRWIGILTSGQGRIGVSIIGNIDAWNQQKIDAFLASIH